MISNELEDPKLSLLTVTNVDVSRDLRVAKISVHNQNDEVNRRTVLKGLAKASSFLRRQLAARAGLRVVPELIFYYDDSPERAARIDQLLSQIRAERESNNSLSNGEEASTDGVQAHEGADEE